MAGVIPSRHPTVEHNLIFRSDTITFNGTGLRLGTDILHWQHALKGNPLCTPREKLPVVCTWNEFGIVVGTYRKRPAVAYINVHLKDAVIPPYLAGRDPDEWNLGPQFGYKGKLIFDSASIVGDMPFREVLAKIDASRGVRCGLRDCTVASGSFDKETTVYFDLNGRRTTDPISIIALSRTEASDDF